MYLLCVQLNGAGANHRDACEQFRPAAEEENERPAAAAATKPEPFDGATAEKMAAQCVTLETDAGSILIEMLAETAPETARNFLNLAATGAFDTTTFNRTVKGFVIQGGHLATRPSLTPELAARSARSVPDEPNPVKHVRGIVSMARSDQPNSAKTSFFISSATARILITSSPPLAAC